MATVKTELSDTKLKSLRALLETRHAELDAEIENLENDIKAITEDESGESGTGGNHPANEGSDVRDAEQSATIHNDLDVMRQQVVEALQRMDDGMYGLCQRCGKPINPERLEALPYAAYDIECQAEMERAAGL